MAVSDAELAEKRRRADQLRSEISSLRLNAVSETNDAANELASVQLDAEIERLEREKSAVETDNRKSQELARAELARLVGATPPVREEKPDNLVLGEPGDTQAEATAKGENLQPPLPESSTTPATREGGAE